MGHDDWNKFCEIFTHDDDEHYITVCVLDWLKWDYEITEDDTDKIFKYGIPEPFLN